MLLQNLLNNMREPEIPDFSSSTNYETPFPHFSATSVLSDGLEKKIYEWLESTSEWLLVETDFYEQYEFSLLGIILPKDLRCLTLISDF